MRKNAIVLSKQEMKKVLGGNGDPGLGGGDGGPCWTSCMDEYGSGTILFQDPQLSLTSCDANVAFRTCLAEIQTPIAVNCWCEGQVD